MKTFKDFIKQAGADKHITLTSRKNKKIQYLLDLPGHEWHKMIKGVVKKVGYLKGGK